jgi:hypothetical protein
MAITLGQMAYYFLIAFTFDFILLGVMIYFRSEIREGWRLRVLVRWFDYCKVRIFTREKRIRNYIIRSNTEIKEFQIENMGIYTIDPDKAYFEGSIPVYTYMEDNFKPLDLKSYTHLTESIKADPTLVDKVVLRAKASGRLAEWFKQQKMMFIFIVLAVIFSLVSAYLCFKIYRFIEPFIKTTLDKVLDDLVNRIAVKCAQTGANTIIA